MSIYASSSCEFWFTRRDRLLGPLSNSYCSSVVCFYLPFVWPPWINLSLWKLVFPRNGKWEGNMINHFWRGLDHFPFSVPRIIELEFLVWLWYENCRTEQYGEGIDILWHFGCERGRFPCRHKEGVLPQGKSVCHSGIWFCNEDENPSWI